MYNWFDKAFLLPSILYWQHSHAQKNREEEQLQGAFPAWWVYPASPIHVMQYASSFYTLYGFAFVDKTKQSKKKPSVRQNEVAGSSGNDGMAL